MERCLAGSEARRRRGFSLVEILLCFAILVAALVPFLGSLGGQARASKDLEGRLKARTLIENTFRVLESLPYHLLLRLKENPGDEALRRQLHLPNPPEAVSLEIAVLDVAPEKTDLFQKVVLTARWEVAGEPGVTEKRQTLVKEKIVVNRTRSLQHDGEVHP